MKVAETKAVVVVCVALAIVCCLVFLYVVSSGPMFKWSASNGTVYSLCGCFYAPLSWALKAPVVGRRLHRYIAWWQGDLAVFPIRGPAEYSAGP